LDAVCESINKVMEIEARGGGMDEILPLISGSYGDHIWQEGKMDTGLISVGQSIGLIHDTVSCQELLDRMVKEAEEVLSSNKARFE
jgi:NADH:quinone reductase (non-electrogenic)